MFKTFKYLFLLTSINLPLATVFSSMDKEIIILNQIEDNFDIHTSLQQKYLRQDNYDNIFDFAGGIEELSKPKDLVITFNTQNDEGMEINNFYVDLADNPSFNNSKRLTTISKEAHFKNLKIGTTYYYRVIANYKSETVVSSIKQFKTNSIGPRNVEIDGMTNARDIGGYKTSNTQRIKQSLIYRNGRFNVSWEKKTEPQFTEVGQKTILEDLQIKTEIDLRKTYQDEHSNIFKSVISNDVIYINCPMEYATNEFYTDNKAMIKAAFNVFSNPEYYPISFHCDIGTDRTGCMSYLLLGLLGASIKDIEIDYLFSNFGNIGSGRELITMRKVASYFDRFQGNTLSLRIRNYLLSIGISEFKINNFINNMIEKI